MKTLIVDIGDVLFHLRRERRSGVIKEHLQDNLAPGYESLPRDLALGFATGTVTEAEYVARVSEHLKVPHYVVYEAERQMIGDMNMKLVKMFSSIRDKKIYCLSNNTPIHWAEISNRLPHNIFSQCFLSHEIGMTKPNSEIYKLVQAETNIQPDSLVLIDDEIENIDGARQVGWHSSIHHVESDNTIGQISSLSGFY